MARKVSTLTFQKSNNYGALLQTYALQTKLLSMGFEAEVMDYHSKLKEAHYTNQFDRSLSLKSNLGRMLSFRLRNGRRAKMREFRESHLHLSKELHSGADLKAYAQTRDFIICGSDQVWNYNGNRGDTTYLLDFVGDTSKKLAYAPSFGVSTLPDDVAKRYRELLQDFAHISVREKAGAAIVRELLGKNVPVVPDPCLLLDRKNWDGFAKPCGCNGSYIFLYYIRYNKEMVQYAKQLAKETGYPVLITPYSIRDLKDGFTDRILSVPEFVGAVRDASFVITNSFHATAFSILFGKDFRIFPDTRTEHNTNSRLFDLLDGLGMRRDEGLSFAGAQYGDVASKRLSELRALGEGYLTESLCAHV